ncbi:MAG: teichoic acid biosynthesis protein [Myxococcales bacterium]|nr:teichoic acid biosynthesis protein [Myxococcales bacterium]
MRILYGVVGEGMGHAIRSRVVLEHLVRQKHELQVVASARAADFLAKHFERVKRIRGFHIIYEDNAVSRNKTLWSNVVHTALRGVPANVAAYFELIETFRPDLVISDFESWTYLYARAHRIPVISIDNMQIINRCVHSASIKRGHETAFALTRAFVKGKLPGCRHYLIATFFRPELRKKRTTLVPPILRSEVLLTKSSPGEHILVYQTGTSNEPLLAALANSGLPCHVYGIRRDLEEDVVEGNLRFRPFSEAGFVADLASSRAVIAGGGFTLMGEAVYLKKPMLSVPVARQFEQVMNGRYLAKAGFGMSVDSLDDPAAVHAFLRGLPAFESALSHYEQDGNTDLYAALDGLMDRAEAGVL